MRNRAVLVLQETPAHPQFSPPAVFNRKHQVVLCAAPHFKRLKALFTADHTMWSYIPSIAHTSTDLFQVQNSFGYPVCEIQVKVSRTNSEVFITIKVKTKLLLQRPLSSFLAGVDGYIYWIKEIMKGFLPLGM